MSIDENGTPLQKIVGILRESGANVYVVAVASPDADDRMRALLGMNGSGDDIIQLLASIIRSFVDEMKFPDKKAKREATASVLSRLMAAVVVGANGEVHSVGPL